MTDSIAAFFAMGGYAFYVWPSLGLTAVVMVGLLWSSWRGLRSAEGTLESLCASRSHGVEGSGQSE